MIGNQIKKLRTEKGMTQKQLADKLFVSAQAVSRWENNDVEPSVETITELARIFGVTTDEILGVAEHNPQRQPEPEQGNIAKEQYIIKEAKPVLAVCEKCNRPIYESEQIVRHHGRGYSTVLCRECEEKRKKQIRDMAISRSKKLRIHSFIWGTLGALVMLGVMIFIISNYGDSSLIPFTVIAPIAVFTMISCCILQNNFIGDVIVSISSWGIRLPGVIFGLDLDGIIWFLTIKLALFILGIFGTLLMWTLALLIGGALSLAVYPFAIYKNVKHPEDTD